MQCILKQIQQIRELYDNETAKNEQLENEKNKAYQKAVKWKQRYMTLRNKMQHLLNNQQIESESE